MFLTGDSFWKCEAWPLQAHLDSHSILILFEGTNRRVSLFITQCSSNQGSKEKRYNEIIELGFSPSAGRTVLPFETDLNHCRWYSTPFLIHLGLTAHSSLCRLFQGHRIPVFGTYTVSFGNRCKEFRYGRSSHQLVRFSIRGSGFKSTMARSLG